MFPYRLLLLLQQRVSESMSLHCEWRCPDHGQQQPPAQPALEAVERKLAGLACKGGAAAAAALLRCLVPSWQDAAPPIIALWARQASYQPAGAAHLPRPPFHPCRSPACSHGQAAALLPRMRQLLLARLPGIQRVQRLGCQQNHDWQEQACCNEEKGEEGLALLALLTGPQGWGDGLAYGPCRGGGGHALLGLGLEKEQAGRQAGSLAGWQVFLVCLLHRI